MKYIIIGGDAAGMSTASKLKRSNQDHEIIVYEMTGETSYGACGLPYFIGGDNDDIERIRIRRPEEFRKRGIAVYTFHKVVKVDDQKKQVVVLDIKNGNEITDSYDQLVIASGASPILPPFPGYNLEGVHTLKTIQDAEKIRQRVLLPTTKEVVIVGAGYIGLELAEAFLKRGLSIRMIEMQDAPMKIMDKEFTDLITESLKKNRVKLHLLEKVQSFEGESSIQTVVTDKGRYPADLVIVSVGVRPNTQFLKETAIKLAPNGAIVVDQQMKTNIKDIFAAGDCAQITNKLTGKNVYLPLGSNANKQGKILGEVLSGKEIKLEGVVGTSMCRILDLEMARTGLNMADAKVAGIPCEYVITKAANKPHYYPKGFCMITIKLFYHPNTHVILGFQLAGENDAASRIDACALAVDRGMTCEELSYADLGYVPPVSPAWDPIQVAASMVK